MRDVYSEVTDRIVAELEKGVMPWSKPWQGRGMSRPLRVTGEPYRGINVLVLWMAAERAGYSNPVWMTYRQAAALGAHVRKGEKGTMVVFWQPKPKTAKAEAGNETDGETQAQTRLITRSFFVFNCDQIDDLPEKFQLAPPVERPDHQRIPEADAFIANTGMDLRFGGDMAFYRPSQDYVQMPDFDTFDTVADYYCTLNHEAIHWTKDAKRLDRDLGRSRWGDEGYAMEELVAELGSAYLAADLSFSVKPRAGHASYIANWLNVLKDDKKAIFTAASLAEKAVKFLHEKQPAQNAKQEAEIDWTLVSAEAN